MVYGVQKIKHMENIGQVAIVENLIQLALIQLAPLVS